MELDEKTGLIAVDSPVEITDGISNITITGALSNQKGTTSDPSQTSSSGVAIGASVVVSDIQKEVNALIADNAEITLNNDLNVKADTLNQTLNLALAGAFAGGVKLKKIKATVLQLQLNLQTVKQTF